jgi:Predicted hydrolase (HAD superfamily)
VLSNVDDASLARTTRALGVRFDAVLTAEGIGHYKPHPACFDALVRTVEAMGVARSRLLHVAQSLFHDIAPARRAGLATCWVDRRGRPGGATPPAEATADWTVHSLAELADRLLRS